ncbi:hypothetical protein M011DRAFT_304079 [Sporormia fimetaria CBS 119925]|uniref:Uncharacterized protein n=1 Tax=Sporormia fimetaria CBS 119925 TaxID=1340428 RepID=A0A6A6VGJ3_9PLEO|nr:hypothetical protein M011DRAFT_304079 [Sporormia fimetaria CBS 119925]
MQSLNEQRSKPWTARLLESGWTRDTYLSIGDQWSSQATVCKRKGRSDTLARVSAPIFSLPRKAPSPATIHRSPRVDTLHTPAMKPSFPSRPQQERFLGLACSRTAFSFFTVRPEAMRCCMQSGCIETSTPPP